MNRVKKILSQQGRTQAYLCRILGKSANTVNLWCNNKVQPSVDDLYRISEILDCKVSDLILEKDEIELIKRSEK